MVSSLKSCSLSLNIELCVLCSTIVTHVSYQSICIMLSFLSRSCLSYSCLTPATLKTQLHGHSPSLVITSVSVTGVNAPDPAPLSRDSGPTTKQQQRWHIRFQISVCVRERVEVEIIIKSIIFSINIVMTSNKIICVNKRDIMPVSAPVLGPLLHCLQPSLSAETSWVSGGEMALV